MKGTFVLFIYMPLHKEKTVNDEHLRVQSHLQCICMFVYCASICYYDLIQLIPFLFLPHTCTVATVNFLF